MLGILALIFVSLGKKEFALDCQAQGKPIPKELTSDTEEGEYQ